MSLRTPCLWLLLCAACDGAEVPAAPPDTTSDLKAHMQGHMRDVVQLREAVALGHSGATRDAVGAFLDHPVARDLPGDWLPRVAAMGEAAIGVRDAPTLDGMARHAAELSAECGSCHEAVMAELQLPARPLGDSHGERGQRVLELLWAALIVPSTDSFDTAIRELGGAIPAGTEPSVVEPVTRLVDQGAPPAHIAGAVLATCASCHATEQAAPPLRDQVGSRPSLR